MTNPPNTTKVMRSRPRSSRGYLEIRTGVQKGRKIPLPRTGGRLVLGRAPQCDVLFHPVHEKIVSRTHAAVEVRQTGVFLVDLNSVNKTFLGEEAIQGTVQLRDGDWFRLGAAGPVIAARIVPQPATQAPLTSPREPFSDRNLDFETTAPLPKGFRRQNLVRPVEDGTDSLSHGPSDSGSSVGLETNGGLHALLDVESDENGQEPSGRPPEAEGVHLRPSGLGSWGMSQSQSGTHVDAAGREPIVPPPRAGGFGGAHDAATTKPKPNRQSPGVPVESPPAVAGGTQEGYPAGRQPPPQNPWPVRGGRDPMSAPVSAMGGRILKIGEGGRPQRPSPVKTVPELGVFQGNQSEFSPDAVPRPGMPEKPVVGPGPQAPAIVGRNVGGNGRGTQAHTPPGVGAGMVEVVSEPPPRLDRRSPNGTRVSERENRAGQEAAGQDPARSSPVRRLVARYFDRPGWIAQIVVLVVLLLTSSFLGSWAGQRGTQGRGTAKTSASVDAR